MKWNWNDDKFDFDKIVKMNEYEKKTFTFLGIHIMKRSELFS